MNRQLSIAWLTTCLLTWLATITVAQTTTITLTGYVVDAATGKAMPFANVYLNGSTRGTITNEEGHYSLTGVPLGTVEVVASFVGYQQLSRTLRLGDNQDNKANFRLKPSDQTLFTVTVRGNQKKWERHLKQFKRQLFGEPFGGQCQIMNPDVLSFKEENGHLKATATEPLVIENRALGYKLWYDLLYFDGTHQKVYYAGTTRFEEMKTDDERQVKRYKRNRMTAYKGSTRHLMASLVDGTYEKEGFLVYQENPNVFPMKTLANRIVLAGSLATDSTKGHLEPLKLPKMIQSGRLAFERRLLTDKTLIVFYTNATSLYSPYIDARYAYSEIKIPTGEIQLTVDGRVTSPNGMVEYGTLADDGLSTMLPADWQPAKTDVDPATNAPVITQGKLMPPDARQGRIAAVFTDRFHALAPVLFVHTDKPFYATGDRMWLSTYLLDAATNRRPLGETAIHVDLLTPNGKLVQHQWLKVMDGRAAGNFRLSDSLASGTYQLRAYTDEDDGQKRPAFERSIAVYNLLQGTGTQPADTTIKPLDVQVLPEGGHWVLGIESRLGIKVVALDGLGRQVAGVIVDDTGKEVVRFTTNAVGLTSIVMTPVLGRTYQAQVVSVQLDHKHRPTVSTPLPPAKSEGLAFSVDVVSDPNLLALTITNTNRPTVDSVYILIQQQGRLVEQRKILLQNGIARVSLSVATIPSGLNQITLYDATAHPQAERLFFLPEMLPPVRVIMGVNKPRYKPREQTILSLNLNDDGLPAVAALSASITDVSQVPDDTAEATIQTHLLLTGELRGRVEQPNVYVKDNSPETRRAVDDLLLTQGWRRVSGTPETALLGGVSLMGRVVNSKNRPIAGAQLTVASTAAGLSFVRSAGADDKGRFRLAGLPIADTIQLMTQLSDHQLKDLPDKGAHIVLDGPGASWVSDTISRLLNWATLRAQLDAARARQEADSDLYRDKTAKLLKAVTVRARRQEERPDDVRRASLHSDADATITFDDRSPRFANLYEMMRGRVPGVSVTQVVDPTNAMGGNYKVVVRGVGTLIGGSNPLYLLDGMAIKDDDGSALLVFNPGDIERIEVLKNAGTAGIYGVRGGNGVIAFYTKRFRPGQAKSGEKEGMKPLGFIGYASIQREFYVPRYEAADQQPGEATSGRVDRRDVLYWKPLVQTDGQGYSQLIFPLSDVVRTIRVTVQGITAEGRPVVGVSLIQVQ